MNARDLIGAVAARLLRQDLERLGEGGTDGGSVARYHLHKLTGPQVAAIARSIHADTALRKSITLRIPRALVVGEQIPDDCVTDENAAYARNAPCDTPMLVLANTLDSLGDTLGQITRLGAPELKATPREWVAALMPSLPLPPDQAELWSSALIGLLAVEDVSLDLFAAYVEATSKRVGEDGQPLIAALGWALPILNMPRDSGVFLGIKDRDLASAIKWKKLYQQIVSQRRPLLRKQFSSRGGIDRELLVHQFEKAKVEIANQHHAAIEAFVDAPPGWNAEAETLAGLEWERDNIRLLFDGLRKEPANLGHDTAAFLSIHEPEVLSDRVAEYLRDLAKRRSNKDPREDDVEFYEAQRTRLVSDRTLRAKWDRFIYGRGVEHEDFLIGILLAIQKLYDQADTFEGPKRLSITTQRKKRPREWLDINFEVLRFFGTKYRGLPHLTSQFVDWDTGYLFRAEELRDLVKKHRKYKLSTSTARNSIQIKFDLELKVGSGATARSVTTQLLWLGRPGAVGMELASDLERVEERLFARMQVQQRTVSKKGSLQSVALDDVAGTLEPAYGKDAGSLVSVSEKSTELDKAWLDSLEKAAEQGRISAEAVAEVRAAWNRFAQAYSAAVGAWRSQGVAAGEILVQARRYGELLKALRQYARGDLNRSELWLPVLSIGVAEVLGGRPAAIVAPWHPLKLLAAHSRMRSLSGLLRHILTAESVNFGDERLFFSDLAAEFGHAYYPEVVAGVEGGSPGLLVVTETVNDYSLAELPVRDERGATTNENPTAAAKLIQALVQRFLALQPHEQANLSLALYNCDSIGLPIAMVSSLTGLEGDGDVRCSITLRHHDPVKLGAIYGQLLESIDVDPDAVVASESSRDFMAKLRIGIMLDPKERVRPNAATKPVDIAFLQDVVSRRARVEWLVAPAHEAVSLVDHVPARWSYKRSSAEDELKSTAFLACPRQPDEGWAYVDAVFGAVAHRDLDENVHMIPVRQIVFQDAIIQNLFKEVHELAEWVVNFDDLLDKRQLLNQGVTVIRHQRQRNQGRSVLVSSTSPLRMLEVLVKRRLEELSLDLPAAGVGSLATRLITEASSVSGDIVLRAAKNGVAAGELIGLALSKLLIEEELRPTNAIGWYFLDDYASWLNQKEGRIADLLALNPTDHAGSAILRVVVSEAKYVGASDVADGKRDSAQQLQDTVVRMSDALFGDPGRLDRDLWLSRLSDLLLDAVAIPAKAREFEAVRDGVRQGTLAIELRGYSHVFVSGPENAPVADEQLDVPHVQRCLQEVFSRDTVRRLLKAYAEGSPLTPIRASMGDARPWEVSNPLKPAPPVSWMDSAPMPPLVTPDVKMDPTGGSIGSGQTGGGSQGSGAAPLPEVRGAATIPSASNAPASEKDRQAGAVETGDARTIATKDARPLEPSRPELIYTPGFMQLVNSRATTAVAPESNEWLANVEQRLKTALLGYHLGAHVIARRLTPNAGLIRLQGSDKLSVEQVEKRRSELLTTHALPIISISGLPGEIVVAIARQQREVVSLWNTLKKRKINRDSSGLNRSFVVGTREVDGEILYLNLGSAFEGQQQHAPHTLVAGATGSGKSVLVQNIILDICATNPPALAQVLVIDPKQGVDYAPLKALPHITEGIIVERDKAVQAMQFLVAEMDRRYGLFSVKGAKDLPKYNSIERERRLPAIWLVHDEFAEWMLIDEYKVAVTEYVSRLGTKARAAGIHLIFAAQRPDNNVFPMQLRDNLGNRLVLRVESIGTSEIALKTKGAERLLGNGHLAASLSGEPEVIYAQVPYLSEDEAALAAAEVERDLAQKGIRGD